MKIKTKRITALAIALLMPYLVSCKKQEPDISLEDTEATYGITASVEEETTKEETEPVEVFEEFEAYLTEDIQNDELTSEKYDKVKVWEKDGDKYLVENSIYESTYLNEDQISKLPKDYIEVDISDQTLRLYKDGEEVLYSDVVTGKNSTPTDLGCYEIDYKTRAVTLKGSNGDGTNYASYVDFWMPFNGGEGFHDATWRSEFGGDIYENSGSHGCVNMPPSEAEELYNNIDSGTKVLIHK